MIYKYLKNSSFFTIEQIIHAMPHTANQIAEQLIENLIQQVLAGTIVWKSNLIATFEAAIKLIDEKISTQLNQITHHSRFLALEGHWRGLYYLIKHIEIGELLKVNVLNASKSVIKNDLSQCTDVDQSFLFKKIYEEQFGTPGGEPYSLFVWDAAFNHSVSDVNMLQGISHIAASAFCPVITSASPALFGLDHWKMLADVRDITKNFNGIDYIEWKALRRSDHARFIVLTLPRVLARLPYGKKYLSAHTFHYEEQMDQSLYHEQYCWMSAAYVYAVRITAAFSRYGWCTAIRGMESGGKVANLPVCTFLSDDGDVELKCPTEVGITDRKEAELSQLGFIPICHYKHTNYAVFFGAETLHQPKTYDAEVATKNSKISARLPYMMAVSRFTHYLKIMARDKVGTFVEKQEIENWLNRWILNYVNANMQATQNLKAKYPLAEAKISIKTIADKPGSYKIIAWLRPWLHLEELTASMRLVTHIPKTSDR
jgi:type VI secretion system protein ImpC